jgi:hypothetical protein
MPGPFSDFHRRPLPDEPDEPEEPPVRPWRQPSKAEIDAIRAEAEAELEVIRAARQAADQSRPVYYRRGQVSAIWGTLSRDQREAAVREGRVIPNDAPIPEGGRPYVPPEPERPTFTRAQLRDHAFFEANKAAILEATREGRIVDGNDWQVRRSTRP